MSNISITTLCNKKCVYCFAEDSRIQRINNSNVMSMEVFDKALDYLQRSGIRQLRLLGGEPTLHPKIVNMIETGLKRGLEILLFSNGIMGKKILNYLSTLNDSRITILMNTIHPLEKNYQGELKQIRTMEILQNKVMLGINIYSREQQLDYLSEYILKYNLKKEIRIGLAHPLLSKKNANLHPKYYKEIGLKIFEYFQKASCSGIKIGFDCGFVPCMFPEVSFDAFGEILNKAGRCCNPIIDLLPDGNFISCYPLNNLEQIGINNFINSENLNEIFNHALKPYEDFGIYPYCRDCELFKVRCSGGCVSAKINRLRQDSNNHAAGFFSAGEKLNQEFKRAASIFDINSRIPPRPYRPQNEDDLIDGLKTTGLAEVREFSKNLSIYIHIPFCQTKCLFCDLYSFPINNFNSYLIDEYINAVIKEIEIWGKLTGDRYSHVTTIHFGGGSPLFIPKYFLEMIIHKLGTYFKVDENTEIAAELTTDDLNKENIEFLNAAKISRVHLGVQTLNDRIRRQVGRTDSLDEIEGKIEDLKKINAVISVDLMFGLPNQTRDGLLYDINELVKFGIDGFALYELKRCKDEMNFFLPNKYEKFQMCLLGRDLLNTNGFYNVFYNHYGNSRDKNLYFTFLDRHEDCLAVGCISDGIIGKMNYRHKNINSYISSVQREDLGIDYCFLETAERTRKKKMEIALMSTKIPNTCIEDMINFYDDKFSSTFDLWKSAGLIKENGGQVELTGSGCFLISEMIEQVRML